jgi:hypothetical protein
MSVSNLTNGCKKETKKFAPTFTRDQLVQVQLGLQNRMERLQGLLNPKDAHDPEDVDLREQIESARQALDSIRRVL